MLDDVEVVLGADGLPVVNAESGLLALANGLHLAGDKAVSDAADLAAAFRAARCNSVADSISSGLRAAWESGDVRGLVALWESLRPESIADLAG